MKDYPKFLRAALGERVTPPPVWIMRQAGRYLPEYRAIKEKYSFWEMCKNPQLAAEVTLQPLRRFPLDAAILFSDIMTPLLDAGVEIQFAPGPTLAAPLRDEDSIRKLTPPPREELAPYVSETIRILRSELDSSALLGFAGSPFTLAAYLVEGKGSKDFRNFRALLYSRPELAKTLLQKLTELTADYLLNQIDAGVDAVQIFDSWAGIASPPVFEEFALPYLQTLLSRLKGAKSHAGRPVPVIYFALNAHHLYPQIASLPAEVIGIDWKITLSEAKEFFPDKTLQGNFDPALLFAPTEVIERELEKILLFSEKNPHIFNLGHGIYPETPVENVAFLVEKIKNYQKK